MISRRSRARGHGLRSEPRSAWRSILRASRTLPAALLLTLSFAAWSVAGGGAEGEVQDAAIAPAASEWETTAVLRQPVFKPRISVGPDGWVVAGHRRRAATNDTTRAGVLIVTPEGVREAPSSRVALRPSVLHDPEGGLHLVWIEPEEWGPALSIYPEGTMAAFTGSRARIGHASWNAGAWSEVTWPVPSRHFIGVGASVPLAWSEELGLLLTARFRELGPAIVDGREQVIPRIHRSLVAHRDPGGSWILDDLVWPGSGAPPIVPRPGGGWMTAGAGEPLSLYDFSPIPLDTFPDPRPHRYLSQTDNLWITLRGSDPGDREIVRVVEPGRRVKGSFRAAVSEGGTIHLIWTRYPHAQGLLASSLWHTRSEDGGRTWSPSVEVWRERSESDLFSADAMGNLVVTGEDLHLAFRVTHQFDTGPETVAYHVRYVDGRWLPVPSMGTRVNGVDLAVDPDGQVWAVLTELVREPEERWGDGEFRTRILRFREDAPSGAGSPAHPSP